MIKFIAIVCIPSTARSDTDYLFYSLFNAEQNGYLGMIILGRKIE